MSLFVMGILGCWFLFGLESMNQEILLFKAFQHNAAQSLKILPDNILNFFAVCHNTSLLISDWLICVLHFFLLVNWAKGLSVLLILSRTQWIFVLSFASISLISALICIISCCWLSLYLVCSCFSKFLSCTKKSFVCALSVLFCFNVGT